MERYLFYNFFIYLLSGTLSNGSIIEPIQLLERIPNRQGPKKIKFKSYSSDKKSISFSFF